MKLRKAAAGAQVRLRDDRSGVALVEFAIVLPFLVLLLTAVFQLSDGLFVYIKVTKTARTLADLTSQYSEVATSDLTSILNASQQVLAPYDNANARLVISQIRIDASGNATVSWSQGLNTAAKTTGAWFYVPPAYKQNGTTIIVADVTYNYTPAIVSSLMGSIALREQVTMFPRKSTTITKI